MNTLTLNAFLLAGTRASQVDEIAESEGVACKALADVGGAPMIHNVIDALRRSNLVNRIILSMPKNAIFDETIERVDSQRSPVSSLQTMLEKIEEDEAILITTADHALLNPAIIQSFVNQYDATSFDLAVAMLPLDILSQKYPDMNRTRLKFKDGNYKACNLFIIQNKKVAHIILNFWLEMEENRKKPWKMIRVLGWSYLFRYITGQLSLEKALSRLGSITSTKPQAVMLDIPEAAIDVDTVSDLKFVRNIVSQKYNKY